MRRLLTIAFVALASGCVGPHSTGALWAQQMTDRERTLFQLNDAQRAALAHVDDLGLADEALAAERARVMAMLQSCPGPRQALGVSTGDKVRDGIRLRTQGDTARLAAVANVALADWYARRAAESQDAALCNRAQAALGEHGQLGEPSASQLLDTLPAATVSRDPSQPAPDLTTDTPVLALSDYVLGQVSAVRAPAPLPQYLALVYGGTLVLPTGAQPTDAEAAKQLVDNAAPSLTQWEPDALYAALRGGQP